MPPLQMTVNGQAVSLDVPEGRTLADVLRYDLGLTGTKIGCGEGTCGACTVLVDGKPVRSCRFPALKAQGAQVLTIEGLAREGQLHPLQEAFIRHGALQCGFCTPGMIMAALGLLLRNPEPHRRGDFRRTAPQPLPLYRLPEHRGRRPRGRRAGQ
jgi:carbon-monoxide dehydrogenase small subunit